MKGEGRKRVKNGVQRILMKGGKGKEKGNEGGRRILKVGLRGGGGGGQGPYLELTGTRPLLSLSIPSSSSPRL